MSNGRDESGHERGKMQCEVCLRETSLEDWVYRTIIGPLCADTGTVGARLVCPTTPSAREGLSSLTEEKRQRSDRFSDACPRHPRETGVDKVYLIFFGENAAHVHLASSHRPQICLPNTGGQRYRACAALMMVWRRTALPSTSVPS